MDSPEMLENWKAAGLLAGLGCGLEFRKLSNAAAEAEKGGVKLLKQLGTAALQSAIAATVGTTVGTAIGKRMGRNESKKHESYADKNIATAAPQIFRAGFDEGMRRGLTESAIKKEKV